jgi:hypothetical protein
VIYKQNGHNIEIKIVEHLREILLQEEIIAKFRRRPEDFTRNRVLTFARVVILILRGHKMAMQNVLNKVMRVLGVSETPTASAYAQARKKIKPEVFEYLNQVVVRDYYELGDKEGKIRRWKGHRVIAFDGSLLNLPASQELATKYTVQTNQYGEYVQAQAGVLYDVLNDVGLGAILQPVGSETEMLISMMLDATQPGDILVLDRHFQDFYLLAYAWQHGREIVVRCPHVGFRQVLDFWDSPASDIVVELSVSHHTSSYRHILDNQLPHQVKVRLVKFKLTTSETEVLMTTLLDAERYTVSDLDMLYNHRWGEETYFHRIKSVFELERFSGQSVQSIQQDFFGTLFLATLESVLAQKPQAQLCAREEQKDSTTIAKVNRAQSYVALLDRIVELLVDPNQNAHQVLDELQRLFLLNPSRHFDGRSFPRYLVKPSRKARFYQYIKRIIA